MILKVFHYLLVMLQLWQNVYGISTTSSGQLLHRSKRVVFIRNSGIGYIVAIATPANPQILNRHVFMAFNFETNYGLPYNDTFSPTKLNEQFSGVVSSRNMGNLENDLADLGEKIESTTKDELPKSSKRKRTRSMKPQYTTNNNLFTRKRFYRIVEEELFKSGFNGTACLLKTICETAEIPVYETNGVFGSVFHVLFTPTASEDENLPDAFYDAEFHGINESCIDMYGDHCPKSLLHFISKVL